MCYRKKIQTTVLMPPSSMGKEWKKNVFDEVCKKMVGTCTQDDGYITSIKKIVSIHDQHITRVNGYVRFRISVIANVILPTVGESIQVVVDMIFPHGVFCYYRMIRVMLPLSKCHGFVLKPEFSMIHLVHTATKITIKKGDTIPVMIDDARYENDLYSCIVELDLEGLKAMKEKKQIIS